MATVPKNNAECQEALLWLVAAVEKVDTSEKAQKVIDKLQFASHCSDELRTVYSDLHRRERRLVLERRSRGEGLSKPIAHLVAWSKHEIIPACENSFDFFSKIKHAMGLPRVDWEE